MDAESLRSFLPELTTFLARFDDCFLDHRSRDHLPVYVSGQLSNLIRKTAEPIAKQAGVPPRTLQQFLSGFLWNHERMRDRVQQIVASEHAGPASIGLIDETSFVKKGNKTPGVQRQWCGHLGKVDNCVVTVHLAYAQEKFQCILDGDLFLPKEWDDDRKRCKEAGIPDSVVYRPKWKIALEQYDRAVAQKVKFDWLTFDEGYGSKPEFLQELSTRNQRWIAEVPKSVFGWLKRPRVTERPYRTNRRGRPRTKPRLVSGQPRAKRLDVLLTQDPLLRDLPWQKYRLDDRDKGPSVWEVKHVQFHQTDSNGLPGEMRHLVIARHVLQEGELKYFLSNAPEGTATETLLWVALNRHRVERCFQDSKSEVGMDHFEGRAYAGLIRHLFLTMVSFLFLIRAVKRRRGEKSGVDFAADPSRGGGADRGEMPLWESPQGIIGETGQGFAVRPKAHQAGTLLGRKVYAPRVAEEEYQTERCDTVSSAA